MGYSDTFCRFEARGLQCPHHLKFRWRRRKIRPYGLKLFTGYGGETYSNRFKIEYLEPVIDKGSERARIRTELKKTFKIIKIMEYTEIQMLNWARELKSKYDEAIGNPDLLEVVDQMADFLDEFIKQNQ